jgi:replicative DNA helicase
VGNFISGTDALAGWRKDLLSGKPPVLYRVGEGFESVQIGPGLVTLLGGAPGAGKTALAVQWLLNALHKTESLRGCIANVEMAPQVLLDRQLARLSGIDLSLIRHRKWGEEHKEQRDQGLAALETLCERLCFVRPPFDLKNIAEAVDAFDAGLILLDYVQRIGPPGEHKDKRGSVDATMNFIRQFADAGQAVIAVAAVGRSKDSRGRSSYDAAGLGLASFKESGELEYGADSAYLLCPDRDGGDGVLMRCLKNRYGEPQDIALEFCRKLQHFAVSNLVPNKAGPDPSELTKAAAKMAWAKTNITKEKKS